MFYISIFLIYSIFGFLFESGLALIKHTHFNSGILYGPWTFMYGIAIFVIVFVDRFIKRFRLDKWKEIVIFFITITLIMTLIEFSGGKLIEKLFHVVYWNYESYPLHYGPYISLPTSLLWGVFATSINYLVNPKLFKLIKKIPWYITIIGLILFIIDVLFTIINK